MQETCCGVYLLIAAMDDYHVSYFQTSLANCIAFTNATLAVGEKFLYLVFRNWRFDATGNKESTLIRVHHIKYLLFTRIGDVSEEICYTSKNFLYIKLRGA